MIASAKVMRGPSSTLSAPESASTAVISRAYAALVFLDLRAQEVLEERAPVEVLPLRDLLNEVVKEPDARLLVVLVLSALDSGRGD